MDAGNTNEIGCASMLLISILGITSLITFFRTIYLFIQSLKQKTFDPSRWLHSIFESSFGWFC
jgi:hypothetical protein